MDSPTQTHCSLTKLVYATPEGGRGRRIEADFGGGVLTSNGGALLLGLADRATGLPRRLAECFKDFRDPTYTRHGVESMVGQRVLGLALGYEDLNDHDALRDDPVRRAVLGRLASDVELRLDSPFLERGSSIITCTEVFMIHDLKRQGLAFSAIERGLTALRRASLVSIMTASTSPLFYAWSRQIRPLAILRAARAFMGRISTGPKVGREFASIVLFV